MRKLILLLSSFFCMIACNGTKTLLPNVSGKAGEVIVVIEKEDWEGKLGNEVRALLASECPYLAQREPLYTLVNVAHGGFGDLLKVHRNIVYFNLKEQLDSTKVLYRRDIWSHPQCLVQIDAKNSDDAIALLSRDGEKILSAIEQAERDRVIANSIRYEDLSIAPQVSEVFGGSAHFPLGYKLRKKTFDFIWIADDKQSVMQDILIYRYPALDNDPFSAESIIRHRNEILKANVPGMFDNTWMTTSSGFPVTVDYMKYQGRNFAQTRGYWEVANDYMGGPFVSHSFYSPDGGDIIVIEAFVYAPKYDKRQYLRQVESILYSWEWKEEKKEKREK